MFAMWLAPTETSAHSLFAKLRIFFDSDSNSSTSGSSIITFIDVMRPLPASRTRHLHRGIAVRHHNAAIALRAPKEAIHLPEGSLAAPDRSRRNRLGQQG